MTKRAPDRDDLDDDRLSLYPLTFEEALQAALSVNPRDLQEEEGETDGARS